MLNHPKIISFNHTENLERFFPLIKELRPHLTSEVFLELYTEANEQNGYQLLGFEEEDELIAIMGYRVLCDFVHGRHLYIDDLGTSEKHRSKGVGKLLLKYAETIAAASGCTNLRLCTGIDNKEAMKFYERNEWNLRAVAYKKKL